MRLPIDTGTVKFAAAGPAEPVLDYETRAPKLDENDTALFAVPLFGRGWYQGLDHGQGRRERQGSQRVHGGEGHQLDRHYALFGRDLTVDHGEGFALS